MGLRRLLARAILRLIGPELRAEAKRIAEAEANMAGAVALTISETKIANAVERLSGQDCRTLALMGEALEQRDLRLNAMAALLTAGIGALPGESKPARDDATFEVVPPEKLN